MKTKFKPGTDEEKEQIQIFVRELELAEKHDFPAPGTRLEAPDTMGVYLIRNPAGVICHVGSTHHAGLRKRLNNHLQNASSFSLSYLKGRGAKLRNGWTYAYIEVPGERLRPLVEHLAVGLLCPQHIGTHKRKKDKKGH